jgi:hypothetical protein
MTSTNEPETARRYPEAYEFNAKREREGRTRMRHAWFIGLAGGLLCAFVALLVIVQILGALAASRKGNPPFGTIFLVVWAVSGLAFGIYWYKSGLRMVLSAQLMLVAIDTEQNTREIAEALRRSQTVKS